MPRQRFTQRTLLPVSAETAYDWHLRPGAFERLTPPWESVEVLSRSPDLTEGSRVELRMRAGPLPQRWVAEHRNFVAGRSFQDVQVSGPFTSFEHTHRFVPRDDQSSWLEDAIEYQPPGGLLGQWLGGGYIAGKLARTFRYRHNLTRDDLQFLQQHQHKAAMTIAITGATGLVGQSLSPFLTTAGHRIRRLVRSPKNTPDDVQWDPDKNLVSREALDGVQAVVHLAGENIAGARWTPEVRERIRSSRVKGTRVLCDILASLEKKPDVLVCASAIGYYGQRGDDVLTEDSPPGTGFLPDVCQEWEAACEPARAAGIRVVNLRIGVVLSPRGGALKEMLPPFQWGVGGVVGDGRQYWSWVALDDVIGSIYHAIRTPELSGPVNAVSPQPVTNREFTKTLGAVLHRPTVLPVPAFALKLALGQMANDLLLSSARVMPKRLLDSGYQFRCETLESALRHVLGREH